MIKHLCSELIPLIPSVQRRFRLEQQNRHFLLCEWPVLHATRNDNEFTLLDPFLPIAEIHAESAGQDEKQLVFVFVVMPDEFALKFHQLYELAVETANDFRPPMFGKKSEFVSEINLVHHCFPPACEVSRRSPG
jgi:hypothetical protein